MPILRAIKPFFKKNLDCQIDNVFLFIFPSLFILFRLINICFNFGGAMYVSQYSYLEELQYQ